jgi:hypothetical protein
LIGSAQDLLGLALLLRRYSWLRICTGFRWLVRAVSVRCDYDHGCDAAATLDLLRWCVMDNPSLVLAISKLAAAVEQAGFTLEQMIDLLDHGLEVEALLALMHAAQPGCNGTRSRNVSIPLDGVATTICRNGVLSGFCPHCRGLACDCSALVLLQEKVSCLIAVRPRKGCTGGNCITNIAPDEARRILERTCDRVKLRANSNGECFGGEIMDSLREAGVELGARHLEILQTRSLLVHSMELLGEKFPAEILQD